MYNRVCIIEELSHHLAHAAAGKLLDYSPARMCSSLSGSYAPQE